MLQRVEWSIICGRARTESLQLLFCQLLSGVEMNFSRHRVCETSTAVKQLSPACVFKLPVEMDGSLGPQIDAKLFDRQEPIDAYPCTLVRPKVY
jgi:hypothetical protein